MDNQGYFQTPNTQVPHNARQPGEIAPIAIQQLQRYRALAETWPIYRATFRENRCRVCDQNIWFSHDSTGHEYQYESGQVIALIVAHIRQNHEGAIDNEDIGKSEILDNPVRIDPHSSYRSNPNRPVDKGSDPF